MVKKLKADEIAVVKDYKAVIDSLVSQHQEKTIELTGILKFLKHKHGFAPETAVALSADGTELAVVEELGK